MEKASVLSFDDPDDKTHIPYWWIIVIPLFFLLLGFTGGYFINQHFLTPTPVQENATKTYISESFGVTFDYPGEFKVWEYPTLVSLGLEGTDRFIFEIQRHEDTNINSVYSKDQTSPNNSSVSTLEHVLVGNIAGEEAVIEIINFGKVRKYYVQRDSDVLTVMVPWDDTSNQIFSTFKFSNK